jgi:hypothetical protein
VLAGVRSTATRGKLIGLLDSLVQVSLPDSIWNSVGDNLSALQANGLTVPFPDAVIVTLGMHLVIEVWSRDKHFPAIQLILPALKLFQEPP